MMKRRVDRTILGLAMTVGIAVSISCSGQTPGSTSVIGTSAVGWSEASHSKATPNYDVVFPKHKVGELQITIAPDDWQAMLDDMTRLHGTRGTGGGPGGGFGGGRPDRVPGSDARPIGQPPGGLPGRMPGPDGMVMPPGGPAGAGGPGRFGSGEKPMWVPATITYEGKTWAKVGVRFKGNSSLNTAWRSGTDRMPWKLDFNQFEDEYPEIKNQRFHGFKQLSLSTAMSDSTYMRDPLAYDLFRDAGMAAAETAFYEVVLDHGNGKTSLGLYNAIEVVDDTVVGRHFKGDKGNIYEGDGPGVSLAQGTLNQIKSSFLKENNKKAEDWSDVEGLYHVLHSAQRTTDPAGWRKSLEAVFDVDTFLHWLAISAVIQHWDTYGGMSHNFYLYNHNGVLTWISWDHNLILGAMGGGPGGPGGAPDFDPNNLPAPPPGFDPNNLPAPPPGFDPNNLPAPPGGGPGGRGGVALDKKNVGNNWPLIRFLLDDPTYYATYVTYLGKTIHGPFKAETMQAKYERWANLLAPYATKQGNGQAFQTGVQSLIQATRDRIKAVDDFLATQAK